MFNTMVILENKIVYIYFFFRIAARIVHLEMLTVNLNLTCLLTQICTILAVIIKKLIQNLRELQKKMQRKIRNIKDLSARNRSHVLVAHLRAE